MDLKPVSQWEWHLQQQAHEVPVLLQLELVLVLDWGLRTPWFVT